MVGIGGAGFGALTTGSGAAATAAAGATTFRAPASVGRAYGLSPPVVTPVSLGQAGAGGALPPLRPVRPAVMIFSSFVAGDGALPPVSVRLATAGFSGAGGAGGTL